MRKRRAVLVMGLGFCSAIPTFAVIPGAIIAYRQSKPEARAAIIAYLKGLI
jgi:hypothetical protein